MPKYFFHEIKLWVLASNLQRFQLRGKIFLSQDWSGTLLRSDTARAERANGKGRSFLHMVGCFALLCPTLDLVVMTGSKWQVVKRGYPWPVRPWVASRRSWVAEYWCSSVGKDPEAVGTARAGGMFGEAWLVSVSGSLEPAEMEGAGVRSFPKSSRRHFAFFLCSRTLLEGLEESISHSGSCVFSSSVKHLRCSFIYVTLWSFLFWFYCFKIQRLLKLLSNEEKMMAFFFFSFLVRNWLQKCPVGE